LYSPALRGRRAFLLQLTSLKEAIMALSTEQLKEAILEKALKSPKAQLYIKDFYACDPDASPRAIKNAANEMVREGKLTFWSSGSTTMYAAKGRAKDEEGSKHI
jgi:hypothetical protein